MAHDAAHPPFVALAAAAAAEQAEQLSFSPASAGASAVVSSAPADQRGSAAEAASDNLAAQAHHSLSSTTDLAGLQSSGVGMVGNTSSSSSSSALLLSTACDTFSVSNSSPTAAQLLPLAGAYPSELLLQTMPMHNEEGVVAARGGMNSAALSQPEQPPQIYQQQQQQHQHQQHQQQPQSSSAQPRIVADFVHHAERQLQPWTSTTK